MAWSDGITKELNDYFEKLRIDTEQAKEALKEQIDIDTEVVWQMLERNAPTKSGGLKSSLRKSKVTVRRNWHGYEIRFEGEDKHGTPYQKIANILNYGTSKQKGTRFVSRAIRTLRGLDERAAVRLENKIKGG